MAGTQGELALLSGWFAWIWIQGGAFTQINDELAKHDAWDPTAMYAQPDVFTLNLRNTRYDGAEPVSGPQFGVGYQGNMQNYAYNLTLAEKVGIDVPVSSDRAGTGRWGIETEFREANMKARDPETDTWGGHGNTHWGAYVFWAMAFNENPRAMLHWNEDATHFGAFDNGGERGLQAGVNMALEDQSLFPSEERKTLSGQFGDPFSAGQDLVEPHGRRGRVCHRPDPGQVLVDDRRQPRGPERRVSDGRSTANRISSPVRPRGTARLRRRLSWRCSWAAMRCRPASPLSAARSQSPGLP